MQQQYQGQKSRNPIIKSSLSSHPSSWDDLADAPPNTDIGDGSCVMSHLGMRLEDGRWLAYELQGDPNGIPVLCAHVFASAAFLLQKRISLAFRYFHGLLGSRLESNFDAQASLVHGVLFISVDRPGYGLSTYSPKRSYLDFVLDVEELLNYLALSKVLVIGFSSGGPYALACAARIPERLLGCSVVSSDLPYADLTPELVKELKGDLKSLNTVFNVAKVSQCCCLQLLTSGRFHPHPAVQWVIPTALKVSTRKAYSSAREFAASMCTGADSGSLFTPARSFSFEPTDPLQFYLLLSTRTCILNFAALYHSERASVEVSRPRLRKFAWNGGHGASAFTNVRS